jgi:hypothetical protein
MIIPVLAGLGALAGCMSNPPRRRRARRNPRIAVKVFTTGGDSWVTEINATPEEAKQYFVGNRFNIGRGERDRMVTVKRIEVLRDNPLTHGCSAQAISDNIRELRHAGHKPKQAVAIALREARVYKRKCKHLPKSVRYRSNPVGGWWAAYKPHSGAWSIQRVGRQADLLQAEKDGWDIVLGDTREAAVQALAREARMRGIELAQRTNPDSRTAVTQRLPAIRATRPIPREHDPRTAETKRMQRTNPRRKTRRR